jgi:hypothetical protein
MSGTVDSMPTKSHKKRNSMQTKDRLVLTYAAWRGGSAYTTFHAAHRTLDRSGTSRMDLAALIFQLLGCTNNTSQGHISSVHHVRPHGGCDPPSAS